MSNERNIIYLAALLHDIGKFYQRADKSGVRNSENLLQEVKNLEAMFCPVFDGKYSHKHVLWTAQFMEEFKSNFIDLFGVIDERILFKATVAHHRPEKDFLQEIIQKADHLASGMDRTKDSGMKDGQDEQQWDAFKKKRVIPLLGIIGKDAVDCKERWPVVALDLNRNNFPREDAESNEEGYDQLWSKFCEEFREVSSKDFEVFSFTLNTLLLKYTTCIPSSTINLPDVSLYDHLQSTAAFAVCLYDYLKEKGLQVRELKEEDEAFLLIGGDLSGIQSFIYDIISKSAAKNLKGRSFYLQLLVDTIIQELLTELNLPQSCVIYASGGGFYIKAPNVPSIQDKLNAFYKRITVVLFEKHGTSLSLAMASSPFSVDTVMNNKVPEEWKQLTIKLSSEKGRKFASLLQERHSDFFDPIPFELDQKRDAISGDPISKNSNSFPFYEKDGEVNEPKLFLSKVNHDIIELGKKLKSTDYLVQSKSRISYWDQAKVFNVSPINSDTTWYLFDDEKVKSLKDQLKATADHIVVYRLNDCKMKYAGTFGFKAAGGISFYGGNDYPSYTNGEPKTFDELSGGENDGLRRLGVLRMDVDNLGKLFVDGFKHGMNTFSRYSALSRNLDYFFKGYLNEIWRSDAGFRDKTSIIYSGGDDLFIVGQWNETIRFAKRIREEFKNYTCSNDKLSISGGIAIVSSKFPIAKAALLSGEAEHLAKDHTFGKLEKNAFAMMGLPLNWDFELPYVEEMKDRLTELIGDKEGLNKGLINKIATFQYLAEEQEKKGANQSWKWIMAYDFARATQRIKNSDAKQLLNELKVDTLANTQKGKKLNSKHTTLALCNLAARWAELTIR